MKKSIGGIDYSKWDKMDFSDDDDDDNDDDNSTNSENVPRVTRLDEPSSVTCNPDGSVNIGTTTTTTKKLQKDNKNDKSLKRVEILSEKPIDSNKLNNDRLRLLTQNGGSFVDPLTKMESFWRQDRHEAVLSITFDHLKIASRDIHLEVKGALSYKDRFAAVGGNRTTDKDDEASNSKGEINVRTANGSLIFKGDLAYAIHLPEGEEEVDWEIDATYPGKKMIQITFLKALPMQGLTIWWNKPVMDYPEIDVLKDIEGRSSENNDASSQSKQQKMKATWDEAHRMFREKVKKREKQEIDISM